MRLGISLEQSREGSRRFSQQSLKAFLKNSKETKSFWESFHVSTPEALRTPHTFTINSTDPMKICRGGRDTFFKLAQVS